jgi:FAD-dependent halogenase
VVRRELSQAIQGDPVLALSTLIAACPLISQYLSGATRVAEGP